MKSRFSDDLRVIWSRVVGSFSDDKDEALLREKLKVITSLVSWAPLPFIFAQDDMLKQFIILCSIPELAPISLKIISSIISRRVENEEMFCKIAELVCLCEQGISQWLPLDYNFPEVLAAGNTEAEILVRSLVHLYHNFFIVYFPSIRIIFSSHCPLPELKRTDEIGSYKEAVLMMLGRMVQFTRCDCHEGIFTSCCEFWNRFLVLVQKDRNKSYASPGGLGSPGSMGVYSDISEVLSASSSAPSLFTAISGILATLREVIIVRIVKPEEVIVVKNEMGEVVREKLPQVAVVELHKQQSGIIRLLWRFHPVQMRKLIIEILEKMTSRFDVNMLNSVCWGAGCLGGNLSGPTQSDFILAVMRILLELNKSCSYTADRAIVASLVMYVASRFYKYLGRQSVLLQAVSDKLLSFLHEKYAGIKDMCVDTLLFLTEKSPKSFTHPKVKKEKGAHVPGVNYIDFIVDNVSDHVSDLNPQQTAGVFKAFAQAICGYGQEKKKRELLRKLMRLPLSSFQKLCLKATHDLDVLKSEEACDTVINFVYVSEAVVQAAKDTFASTLDEFFSDILFIYSFYSDVVAKYIKVEGAQGALDQRVRKVRHVKQGIIKLLDTYIDSCSAYESILGKISQLMENLLSDFGRSPAEARESEVLGFFATLVSNLKSRCPAPLIGSILTNLLPPAVDMLEGRYDTYLDHREQLFRLLEHIFAHNLAAVVETLDEESLKGLIGVLGFGLNHITQVTHDHAAQAMLNLIDSVSHESDMGRKRKLFSLVFEPVAQSVVTVFCDTFHKQGAPEQKRILRKIITLVGETRDPIWDQSAITLSTELEQERISGHVNENTVIFGSKLKVYIQKQFPHVNESELETFVTRLCDVAKTNKDVYESLMDDFSIITKI
ncbi:Protein EXPORTIN 1B [Aduncisulcus paluster]|nr:Protein EXPORTIN 1B [Aduncisulcus paluster]